MDGQQYNTTPSVLTSSACLLSLIPHYPNCSWSIGNAGGVVAAAASATASGLLRFSDSAGDVPAGNVAAAAAASPRLSDRTGAVDEAGGASAPAASSRLSGSADDVEETNAVAADGLTSLPFNGGANEEGAAAGAAAVVEAASGRTRKPRSVRVADLDRLTAQLQALQAREEERACRVTAIEDQLAASSSALYGIDVLRAVAVQQQFRLGSALQSILATKMEQRLKTAPPASARVGREQLGIVFDVPFTRCGMDELAQMEKLSYSPVAVKRSCRAMRTLHFADSRELLAAIGFSDDMRRDYACRVFKRQRDHSHPTRVLVESHTDESGCVWYILGRDPARDELRVAVRESEEYSVRLHGYLHPLENRVVPFSAVPALPERCPTFLSWREAPPSAYLLRDGADACGVVTASMPCCVIEEATPSMLDMLTL